MYEFCNSENGINSIYSHKKLVPDIKSNDFVLAEYKRRAEQSRIEPKTCLRRFWAREETNAFIGLYATPTLLYAH